MSPGGSGYFTCIQNMKLVTTEFKSGGLHEKHIVATWNLGNATWNLGKATWNLGNATWNLGNATWNLGKATWNLGNATWNLRRIERDMTKNVYFSSCKVPCIPVR